MSIEKGSLPILIRFDYLTKRHMHSTKTNYLGYAKAKSGNTDKELKLFIIPPVLKTKFPSNDTLRFKVKH